MSPANELDLLSRYPLLTRVLQPPLLVGDGWLLLVRRAFHQLERLSARDRTSGRTPLRVLWVAERCGRLALDVHGDAIHIDAVFEILQEAAADSELACERCGCAGAWRDRPHACVTCHECETLLNGDVR